MRTPAFAGACAIENLEKKMKLKNLIGLSSALCLCVQLCGTARAQETNQSPDFAAQLKQMQEAFEKRQQEMENRFEQRIAAQDAEIQALKEQLTARTNPPPAVELATA